MHCANYKSAFEFPPLHKEAVVDIAACLLKAT